MRMFTKTLAVALTGLCLASTLAFAQPSSTGADSWNSAITSSADAWKHIGPYRDEKAHTGLANPNPPEVDAN